MARLQFRSDPPDISPQYDSSEISTLSISRGLRSDREFNDHMSYEELTQLEDVKVGVKEDIESLSALFQYTDQNLSEKQCTVCMENFVRDDQIRRLNCLHCFHKSCIDQWLDRSKRCPICKIDVTQMKL